MCDLLVGWTYFRCYEQKMYFALLSCVFWPCEFMQSLVEVLSFVSWKYYDCLNVPLVYFIISFNFFIHKIGTCKVCFCHLLHSLVTYSHLAFNEWSLLWKSWISSNPPFDGHTTIWKCVLYVFILFLDIDHNSQALWNGILHQTLFAGHINQNNNFSVYLTLLKYSKIADPFDGHFRKDKSYDVNCDIFCKIFYNLNYRRTRNEHKSKWTFVQVFFFPPCNNAYSFWNDIWLE